MDSKILIKNTANILIILLAITFFSCPQQDVTKEDLKSVLDNYMAKSSIFGFSGGLLVEKNGKIILSKGYGYANKKYMVPFTDNTIIDIASVTKGFTATAILKLYDEGKLDVNDKLSKYFKDVPKDKKNITIHQLLSNSSGLGEFLAAPSNVSRDELVKRILNSPFEGTPDKWYYSNEGFTILAAIINKVSGMSFEDYITQNFITSLKMTHTGFFGDKKWDEKYIGHSYNREKDYGSFANNIDKWNEKGSGNMASSMIDIYNWIKASMRNEFLSDSTYKKQFTKYVDLSNNLGYGFGWFIGQSARNTKFFRLGGNNTPSGITIEIRVFPEENALYILFSNEMIDEIGLVRPIRAELEKIMFDENYENSMPKININNKQAGSNQPAKIISFKNKTIIEPYLNNYVIKTESQDVVNAITTPDEERKELLLKLNKKADALFNDLLRGTYKDKELRDYYWDKIKLKDYKVLCTVPVNDNSTNATFVKVWTPEGQFVFRCMWDEDEFYYINDDVNELAEWKVLKVSDKFIGYDLILKKEFEVRIDGNQFIIKSNGHQKTFHN